MDEVKRCPFCAEEILAAAIKCKHCGSSMTEQVDAPPSSAVVTIERTSKSIKRSQLFGWTLFLLSLYLLFAGSDTRAMGALLFWISVAVIIFTRMARWWTNE